MRGILNDVDHSFKGKLEVIDIPESRKAFCRTLVCKRCLKTCESVAGKTFGIVYPDPGPYEHENIVTMINSTCAPEFLGSFIVFGMADKGKLTSLTVGEVNDLLQYFSYMENDDGRGKYVLNVD